jgi:O-antigen/teichoic acid export membrane protein
MVPLYIRLLGLEAYGLIALFTSISTAFYLFDFGLSTALNKELATLSIHSDSRDRQRNVLKTVEFLYWAIALLAGISLTILSPTFARNWIRHEHLSQLTVQRGLLLMTVAITLQFPFAMYSGGMLGLQQQLTLNAFLIVTTTTRAIGALAVLHLYSPDLQSFLGWQILSAALQTFGLRSILWWNLRGDTPARFDAAVLQRLWRFSAGVAGTGVLTILLSQTDKLLLSTLLTLKEFAYYNIATLVATSMCILAYPICTTVFPRFVQLAAAKDEPALASLYHLSCQAVTVLLIPSTFVLAAFAQQTILIWTHSSEIAAASSGLTTLLAIATALGALTYVPFSLQLANGWTRYGLTQAVLSAMCFPLLLLWMTHLFGIVGAAYARITLYFLQALIGIPITHSRLLMTHASAWLWKDTLRPAAVSVAIVLLSAVFFRHSLPQPETIVWVALTGLAATLCSAMLCRELRGTIALSVHRAIRVLPSAWAA